MSDMRHTFGKLNLGLSALLEQHRKGDGAEGFCLGITSAKAKEGKTFIAAGLAATVAALGRQRVLLVDANFEAPGLHKLYPEIKGPGFSECLAQDDPEYVDESATRTPNLFVLLAGRQPNVELLYRRGTISKFIEHAKKRFDIVMFDCGVLNSVGGNGVTDAVDKLMLVVDSSSTRRELVAHSVRKLASDREDALWGVVLNKKERHLPDFLYERL